MKHDARRGDIWMVDLGIAAKVRPCLLLTDYPAADELALITVAPHTTSLRGNRWEISLPLSYLQNGAFHLQQIQSVPVTFLMRRLGVLSDSDYNLILDKLSERLSI
jgi:mRNA interferase MazF